MRSTLNIHWKDRCWSWSSNTWATWCEKLSHWKRLMQEEKKATEGEMVGWHRWLSRHEFEQTPVDSEGQGSLACCSPWGNKESGMTEQLNNTNIRNKIQLFKATGLSRIQNHVTYKEKKISQLLIFSEQIEEACIEELQGRQVWPINFMPKTSLKK